MKIHLLKFKLNYEDGIAKAEGGIIYDLDNEEQKNHYLKDLQNLKEGYAYQLSVEKEGE